jgi:hypothetical protein
MKRGGDQELIARLRSPSGEVWGALGLYRERGQPLFDDADKQFLLAVAPHLAEGARRVSTPQLRTVPPVVMARLK